MAGVRRGLGALLVTLAFVCLTAACASAPPSVHHEPPRAGYQLHDTRLAGALTIERWVPASNPEVSPAGMCECITVVYLDDRKLLTLGEPGQLAATTVEPTSGKDLTGDSQPEIVASTWSGGAHCCYSTAIYSVSRDVRPVLTIETGNCGPGELQDLDADGRMEVVTCDDRWGYTYCSFAESPMPRVVFAYNATHAAYEIATPKYAARFRDDITAQTLEARKRMEAEGGKDPGRDKCMVLQPALSLMYTGQLEDGRRLIRELYRGSDLDAFEREVVESARTSRLWAAQ